ncbi:MAG TPA: hypothetical protein VHT97_09890 [Acidimicrobiales bacterium]|jgi:F0F1-type ATP synthase membrane subunit b/b'|nr:hypothetical protein [Acidimicrobiales bacterium]
MLLAAMIDQPPFSDDISELWGPEDPGVLEPAPLRAPERPRPPEGDRATVLQRELRRLQHAMAALDPNALRNEITAALAETEARVGDRLDALARRVDELAALVADDRDQLARLASVTDVSEAGAVARYLGRRTRHEISGEVSRQLASLREDGRADADTRAFDVEARLDRRLDDLAQQVAALVERLAPPPPPSEPRQNGHQPVEEAGTPIV